MHDTSSMQSDGADLTRSVHLKAGLKAGLMGARIQPRPSVCAAELHRGCTSAHETKTASRPQ